MSSVRVLEPDGGSAPGWSEFSATIRTRDWGSEIPRKVKSLDRSSVPAVSKLTAPTFRSRSIRLCEMFTFWIRSKRAVCSRRLRMPRLTRSRSSVTT